MIMTGHGRLLTYFYRFKITNNPLCACGVEQTVDHAFFDCEKYKTDREKLKNSIREREQQWSIKKADLITKFKKPFLIFVNAFDLEAVRVIS